MDALHAEELNDTFSVPLFSVEFEYCNFRHRGRHSNYYTNGVFVYIYTFSYWNSYCMLKIHLAGTIQCERDLSLLLD